LDCGLISTIGALVVGGDRLGRHALLRALHQHERIDQAEFHRLRADLLDRVGRARARDDVEIEAFVLVIAFLLAEVERRVLSAAFPVEPHLHLRGCLRIGLRRPEGGQRQRREREPKSMVSNHMLLRIGMRENWPSHSKLEAKFVPVA
jgi:hypothetical protein